MLWVIPGQIKVAAMMESELFTPTTFPYLVVGGLLIVSVIQFINNLIQHLRLSKEVRDC